MNLLRAHLRAVKTLLLDLQLQEIQLLADLLLTQLFLAELPQVLIPFRHAFLQLLIEILAHFVKLVPLLEDGLHSGLVLILHILGLSFWSLLLATIFFIIFRCCIFSIFPLLLPRIIMQKLQRRIILYLFISLYLLFAPRQRKSGPYAGLRKERLIKLVNIPAAQVWWQRIGDIDGGNSYKFLRIVRRLAA